MSNKEEENTVDPNTSKMSNKKKEEEKKSDQNKKKLDELIASSEAFYEKQKVIVKMNLQVTVVHFLGDDMFVLYQNFGSVSAYKWEHIRSMTKVGKDIRIYLSRESPVTINCDNVQECDQLWKVCLYKWQKASNKQHEVAQMVAHLADLMKIQQSIDNNGNVQLENE